MEAPLLPTTISPPLPPLPEDAEISPKAPLLSPLRDELHLKPKLHRCLTAPSMAAAPSPTSPSPLPPPLPSPIVKQALLLLSLYLLLGTLFFTLKRDSFSGNPTHPIVDALYFCIVTMCTIGYGDITPDDNPSKLFSIAFVIIGFGFVDIILSSMVTHVLDIQENILLGRAPGYLVDVKKGRMRIRMKVAAALGVVVLCVGGGAAAGHGVEGMGWVDSWYLAVMSVTTVGYGDRVFGTVEGRIFACVWLLVSTLAVARAFLYLAEARVDRRHRRLVKWVLGKGMTVAEFVAADIDHNGSLSKSEFVICKLKEMGKITERDILPICEQFERLDEGHCGKITLSHLAETHHLNPSFAH